MARLAVQAVVPTQPIHHVVAKATYQSVVGVATKSQWPYAHTGSLGRTETLQLLSRECLYLFPRKLRQLLCRQVRQYLGGDGTQKLTIQARHLVARELIEKIAAKCTHLFRGNGQQVRHVQCPNTVAGQCRQLFCAQRRHLRAAEHGQLSGCHSAKLCAGQGLHLGGRQRLYLWDAQGIQLPQCQLLDRTCVQSAQSIGGHGANLCNAWPPGNGIARLPIQLGHVRRGDGFERVGKALSQVHKCSHLSIAGQQAQVNLTLLHLVDHRRDPTTDPARVGRDHKIAACCRRR